MEKTLLTLAIIIVAQCSYAQTNTLPSSGNVGIGTTSPSYNLEVNGGSNDGILQIGTDAGFNGSKSPMLNFYIGGTNHSYPTGQIKVVGDNNYSGDMIFSTEINGTANPLAERMRITYAGNVGIGTASPSSPLQVTGVTSIRSNTSTDGYISINPGSSACQGYLNWWKPGGARVGYMGYTDGISVNNLALTLEASANFIVNGGNVAIGTTDPHGYKLAVNGDAIATSMTVKLYANWPDYVFRKGYNLPSLTEIKTYIDKNQHLPDMPSEQEVKDNGINLGEIVKVQTKKIEELTLYLIDQQKTNQSQQEQINQLKEQLNLITKVLTKK